MKFCTWVLTIWNMQSEPSPSVVRRKSGFLFLGFFCFVYLSFIPGNYEGWIFTAVYCVRWQVIVQLQDLLKYIIILFWIYFFSVLLTIYGKILCVVTFSIQLLKWACKTLFLFFVFFSSQIRTRDEIPNSQVLFSIPLNDHTSFQTCSRSYTFYRHKCVDLLRAFRENQADVTVGGVVWIQLSCWTLNKKC